MAIYHEDIVNIDLANGSIYRNFLNTSIGSGDKNANRFGVRVFRNGEPVELGLTTVQGFFRNPQGENIAITEGTIVEGNMAAVVLPQACYNYNGNFTLAIKLIGGGVTGTMRIIDGMVSNTNTGGAVSPTYDIPTYQEILAVYEQMEEAVGIVADLQSTLESQYVGFRRYLNANDDLFALDMGAYGISASADLKPANMPTDFTSTSVGYVIVFESESGNTNVAICIQAYARRIWMRTGYEWLEIAKTSYVAEQIEQAYGTMYDAFASTFAKTASGLFAVGNEISNTKTQFRFLDNTGVREIGDSYPDWYVTNEITVAPFTFYLITASAQYNGHCIYNILDANGNIIASEAATGSTVLSVKNKLIVTPHNAAKIQLASVTGTSGLAIYEAVENEYAGGWAGKTWVCIGDSLTDTNIRTTKHYFDYVAEKTGITVVNLGKGGTGYKREYAGEGPFIDRVDQIPLDADVITIFGSGNDAIYTIGDPSDTGTDTLCGAINTTIAAIFARKVTYQLGIVTPCPWESYNPADDTNWMARYSAAIVEICRRWGIPCLDLYHCSNLRPWDATFRAAAYSKDNGNGVHPDETGHAIIAPRFQSFVESLLVH